MSEESRPWRWRNCREIEVAIWLCVMPWQWRLFRREWHGDHTSGQGSLQVGPFVFQVYANIGNRSDETWRARFGLSEQEAWERSE